MKYCLWRILGNDIPLRHSEDRTEKNLAFILDHEPDFPDSEKVFLLNRIHDQDKSDLYKDMINKAGYRCHVVSFISRFYKDNHSGNYESKVDYITNVNSARNYCIKWGLEKAEYSLPLDSGSIFRQDGWDSFNEAVRSNNKPYFLLGQARLSERDFYYDCVPCIKEEYRFDFTRTIALREPAIVFGREADKKFNERYLYGDRDKVELLWRLGVPGIWDRWASDEEKKTVEADKSIYFGDVGIASWIFVLPSDNKEADGDNKIRSDVREAGVKQMIAEVDKKYL